MVGLALADGWADGWAVVDVPPVPDGFTVTTRRDDSGETITAITGSGPSEVTAD